MPEGFAPLDDPRRNTRLAMAIPAAFLLGASGFFNATIRLHDDGSHQALIGIEPVRTGVLVAFALLALWFAANPAKPDPRIARAVMLAAALVAVVLGVDAIFEPRNDPSRVSGVAPYAQLTAAALFLTLRWRRTLWPASRWRIEAEQAAADRSLSRRTR